MTIKDYLESELVALATRTLATAGYQIDGATRYLGYTEIPCEIASRLGPVLRFLIAVRTKGEFTPEQYQDISQYAENERRHCTFVGFEPTDKQLTWDEFLRILGGEIPSWQALAGSYQKSLMTAAANDSPVEYEGEAWLLFEDLVAAGLEFCLGRRVRRLGGRRRGRTVSDMIVSLPQHALMVVDAKATGGEYDVSWPNLRPLVEYTNRQKDRQMGAVPVYGAMIVSAKFKQEDSAIKDLMPRFAAETDGVILSCMTAETLGKMVDLIKTEVDFRSAVRWKTIFSGGLVSIERARKELADTRAERYGAEPA